MNMKLNHLFATFLTLIFYLSTLHSREILIVHVRHNGFQNSTTKFSININTFNELEDKCREIKELVAKKNQNDTQKDMHNVDTHYYWECCDCKQLIKNPTNFLCTHNSARYVIYLPDTSEPTYMPIWKRIFDNPTSRQEPDQQPIRQESKSTQIALQSAESSTSHIRQESNMVSYRECLLLILVGIGIYSKYFA